MAGTPQVSRAASSEAKFRSSKFRLKVRLYRRALKAYHSLHIYTCVHWRGIVGVTGTPQLSRVASSKAKFRSRNFDSKFGFAGGPKSVLIIAYLNLCAAEGSRGGGYPVHPR